MSRTRISNLERLQMDAKEVGLFIDTWSPGDGVTRYRFFLKDIDYFAGSGIYTALGWKEADTFATGFCQGVLSTEEAKYK